MSRRPREEAAGAVHHVYARGNKRALIFLDDADRHAYQSLLRKVATRQGWHCLAYCLMDNHVHLLLETPHPNLGQGMRELHGRYGRAFNDRHEQVGHVFQGRYGSARVKAEAHVWMCAAYIAANPVEAGACSSPTAWPWSSYALASEGSPPPWLDLAALLRYFGSAGGDPWHRYLAAVQERCDRTSRAA